MESVSDAIVVGGGPCGSFAALNLARLGVNVKVFEEHSEIGVPPHCAGHVSINGLKHLGLYPLPSNVVENLFCGAIFHSPEGGEFSVRFSSPVTCVVNRVLFDKYLAQLAEKAGARYYLDSRVEHPLKENGFIKGVTVKQNGGTKVFQSSAVIDAEGVSARLLKQAGLLGPDARGLVNGVEAESENVEDLQSDVVEVFLGRSWAPGFFAWIIPRSDGTAKIGLGARGADPKRLLERFVHKHPVASGKLGRAKIVQTFFHPMTLGGPISKLYANGFLAVGDVASHVKPTTGGGIVLGLTGASAAAQVVHEAINEDDFSSIILNRYQRRCEKAFGFDQRIMLGFRKVLSSMTDRKLGKFLDFCARFKLDKTLRDATEIDFQGQTLLHVLRKPQMLATLSRLLWLSLFPNP